MITVEPPKQLRQPPPGYRAAECARVVSAAPANVSRWFLLAETVSLAVMVGSVLAGISERFAAESLTPLFRVLPVAAAIRQRLRELRVHRVIVKPAPSAEMILAVKDVQTGF